MQKLNFTNDMERPYKFMGAMLAPKGAYYIDYYEDSKWANIYPVMYIQLWQDPDGVVWNVPLWSEEVQENFDPDVLTFQEYIEEVINEDRYIETCLSCQDFICLCRRINHIDKKSIVLVMENLCEYIVKGEVSATPELLDYFKNGVWGDLRTMENDGTLEHGWEDGYLKDDGSLKPISTDEDSDTDD